MGVPLRQKRVLQVKVEVGTGVSSDRPLELASSIARLGLFDHVICVPC